MDMASIEPSKPLAGISLDLDNEWSYMKTHGDPRWQTLPSYLDLFIPLILDLLNELRLKITFFIVGQDAVLEKNHDALRKIASAGHELANHSFHHEPWFRLYSRGRVEKEVRETEDAIIRLSGQKPVGFRGPGFSWNEVLFEVLAENGYIYDSSTLPMFLGPLARMYYFWKSRLTSRQKSRRRELYGNIRDGLRPVKPYLWELPSKEVFLEMPVSTIPILKVPFHLSYLVYLSRYSGDLMRLYLSLALGLCKLTRTSPSFLLHPLDLVGGDQVPELAFFPGMDLSFEKKRNVFIKVINALAGQFRLVNMSSFAQAMLNQGRLRVLRPD
jgi:hypothetical protein